MRDDDARDEPVSASIRRVRAQSPWWWRGPLVPSIVSGWFTYFLVSRRAVFADWGPAVAMFVGVVAASWLGVLGIASTGQNRVLRHTAHYVGVTMIGVAICATLGVVAGLVALAVR